MSLEKVRQIAGHSNLKTTEQYLHIKLDDTRSVLELIKKPDLSIRLRYAKIGVPKGI